MTNKLVVITNRLKYQKLRKFYHMKWNFLYQITAASRTPGYGATTPQIPLLSVLCPQLNLLNPPEQNSWVRHCSHYSMTLSPDKNIADLNRAICYPHIPCALFPLKSAWLYLLAAFHVPSIEAPYITHQICTSIILTLMSEAAPPFETLAFTNKTTWCHNQHNHGLMVVV